MRNAVPALAILVLTLAQYPAQAQLAESGRNRHGNIFEHELRATGSSSEAVKWDINDSLRFLPHYDSYCGWNTERVHPYDVNLTRMKESVRIPLLIDSCSFAPPFIGSKTSDFGYRRYRYHYGVDIKLHTGDAVVSAFEGVVRIAHYDGDYGKVVVVRHSNGLETLYAHLSELLVKEGDWVDAGDVVGLGGNTGRSTGSHLHFEVRYLGEPIDPNTLIDWELGRLCAEVIDIGADDFKYLVELRKRKYYTVRRGDTLSQIARRHGTTVSKLCALNHMRSSNTLRIGQRLRYN